MEPSEDPGTQHTQRAGALPSSGLSSPPSEPPATPLTTHHDPNPFTAPSLGRQSIITRRLAESGSVEMLLQLKGSLIEEAKKESSAAMAAMAQAEELRFTHWKNEMEAAFERQRRADEERWNRERAEMQAMLAAIQEGMSTKRVARARDLGRQEGSESPVTGAAATEMRQLMDVTDGDGDGMEVTITGRSTQLDMSKHAVNVRDRTPLIVQTKNISKHAYGRPNENQNASRPAETPTGGGLLQHPPRRRLPRRHLPRGYLPRRHRPQQQRRPIPRSPSPAWEQYARTPRHMRRQLQPQL
jgi:hypothetical protein